MLDRGIEATVEALLPLLRQFPRGEYGLAVGGAHAKGTDDPESDLDLYVFAGSVLPDGERTQLATQFSPDIREVVSWSCGAFSGAAGAAPTEVFKEPPFENAGTDFHLKNLKVECWLRNSASIDRAIGECAVGIIKRDFVTWTTTGFYNHCCLSDLNAMIPVDDPAGILARWKDRIRTYPPKLREAIIARHLAAARYWPHNFHYRSAIERRDAIYTTGIIQQVVHNLIQVLFAANAVYFPGDKKLSEAIRHLDNAPELFVERVQKLLFPAAPVTVEALRTQQRELQEVLRDVEAVVPRN